MITMHKLRHPITVFIVMVLAVIGIGIGLVGGLAYPQAPSRAYGRPPFSFSAAFPTTVFGGKVTVQCLGGGASCGGKPVVVEWYSPAANNDYYAWVFWINGATPTGANLARLDLPQGYRTHAIIRQGYAYLVAEPTCGHVGYPFAPGTCSDVVVVKKGDVTWVAGAGSKTWPGLPQAFVESFRVAT